MPVPLVHIRGDSFIGTGRFILPTGTTTADWAGTSYVRAMSPNGSKVDELVFAWQPANDGTYIVTKLDTTQWPVGKCFFDVEIKNAQENRVSTDVYEIKVQQDVTYAGT